MDDICFAVKDEDGFYWCGLNEWDKQLRKAKLFHSYKYAAEIRDNRYKERMPKIVQVEIKEIKDYNP